MTFDNRLWLAAALCAPLCMGAQECTNRDAKEVCKYDGKVYAEGDAFPSDDGCNSCSCGPEGEVACTLRACAATCDYEGKAYSEGQSFPASDGCNTCSCTAMGVACTEIGCASGNDCKVGDVSYADGSSVPSTDGCNSCGCNDGSVVCTDIACFEGCESDGMFYAIGQTFKQDCAGCACTKDGIVCDAIACAESCMMGEYEFEAGADVLCEDGCNQCHCGDSGEWAATKIGCPALPQIEVCDGPPASDAIRVEPLYLSDSALALEVELGGGCEEHPMRLCTDGSFLESSPVQLNVWVVDDGKPDPCDAILRKQLVFDLSPLKKLYADGYKQDEGTIILRVGKGSVRYDF